MLALDVDGVLLDAHRGGDGHWTQELDRRLGITRAQIDRAFFEPYWDDVLIGQRPIEPALQAALDSLGCNAGVEAVLQCWFEADFVVVEPVVALARGAAAAGIGVALATDQEHRRAAYLRTHLGALFPLDAIAYSADVGARKVDASFFGAATEILGAARDEVVFVDDSAANTHQAIAAGWTAIVATPDLLWIPQVDALLGLA